jgi:hypothetical protein
VPVAPSASTTFPVASRDSSEVRTIDEATGHHCDTRRVCTRIFITFLLVAAVTTAATSRAAAAGDASLERRIVNGAGPGWTQLPALTLERIAASERGAVSGATGKKVSVAANGWRKGEQSLLVVLIEFPDGVPPGTFKPRDAVVGACLTSTLSAPKSLKAYAAIPGSSEATCAGRNAAGQTIALTAMAWEEQAVFAVVIGDRFSPSELEKVAVQQDRTLTNSAPAQVEGDSGPSWSSNSWELFVIIGVVAALGLAMVFLVVARSRSPVPATTPGPGVPAAYGSPTAYRAPARSRHRPRRRCRWPSPGGNRSTATPRASPTGTGPVSPLGSGGTAPTGSTDAGRPPAR